MRIDRNTFDEIITTITRNKTRSLLTAFGVFWGIFMLITLLGGGKGVKNTMEANYEGFATNSGFLMAQKTSEPYRGFQKGRNWSMEEADIERIRNIEGIKAVTACIFIYGKNILHGEQKAAGTIKGASADYIEVEGLKFKYGRWLNKVDMTERRKVCVLGERIYESLFQPDEDPTGKHVLIDGTSYQVVGVCSGQSTISLGSRTAETIFMPYNTVQQSYNLGHTIHLMGFVLKNGYHIGDVKEEVDMRIKNAHYISPNDKEAVYLLDMENLFGMVESLMTGIELLIWLIGLGTLIAGAIGVSNIMMVTVKERTTEFGIRRAIGAKPRDILEQVLIESMTITAVAGMAGITFGALTLQVIEKASAKSTGFDVPYQISFGLAMGTCILLVVLGMLAGLAPAFRAMSIKPIDAMREE